MWNYKASIYKKKHSEDMLPLYPLSRNKVTASDPSIFGIKLSIMTY